MQLSPIILAMDYTDTESAITAAQNMDPMQCQLKIGKGLFTRAGPMIVERLMSMGFKIFLDLKFHDIPNTVAMACKAAADMGVWMMNVHCLGGARMLHEAKTSLGKYDAPPLLIGVTILTSMDDDDLKQIGIEASATTTVERLAQLAKQSNLDGVVCSAQEAKIIREQCGKEFVLVTPGIRLQQGSDDQRRVMTPAQAIKNGADYLVIGRPVLQAINPNKALEKIIIEVNNAR